MSRETTNNVTYISDTGTQTPIDIDTHAVLPNSGTPSLFVQSRLSGCALRLAALPESAASLTRHPSARAHCGPPSQCSKGARDVPVLHEVSELRRDALRRRRAHHRAHHHQNRQCPYPLR